MSTFTPDPMHKVCIACELAGVDVTHALVAGAVFSAKRGVSDFLDRRFCARHGVLARGAVASLERSLDAVERVCATPQCRMCRVIEDATGQSMHECPHRPGDR